MIKKIIFLAIQFCTVSSFSASLFGQCVTEYPSTSFIFETIKDNVGVVVINHHGTEYAPFWNSPVVPQDIQILSSKSLITRKLDDVIYAGWKKSQCQFMEKNKFVCMGKTDPVQMNELTIEPWAIYSSVVKESSFAGDFESIEVTFRYYENNESHQIVMKYQTNDCILSEEPVFLKFNKNQLTQKISTVKKKK